MRLPAHLKPLDAAVAAADPQADFLRVDLELKSVDLEGKFSGYAAVFGERDMRVLQRPPGYRGRPYHTAAGPAGPGDELG